jgi:hypothetical protein
MELAAFVSAVASAVQGKQKFQIGFADGTWRNGKFARVKLSAAPSISGQAVLVQQRAAGGMFKAKSTSVTLPMNENGIRAAANHVLDFLDKANP